MPHGISERDVACHTDELGHLSLLCGASPTIRYSDQKTEGEKKIQNQTDPFKIKSLISVCFTFFYFFSFLFSVSSTLLEC